MGQLFDASISDREIVKRSGILNSSLWDEGDSLMADRGLTISEDLKTLKVQYLHFLVEETSYLKKKS